MTPTPTSCLLSYSNGKLCEQLLRELLPEFEYAGPTDHIDGEINTVKAEIKSCQKTTQCREGHGARTGRFWFQGAQHEELIENNGVYILLVHEAGVLISSRIVKASLLFPSFEGGKSVSWASLLNRISVSTDSTPRPMVGQP